MKAGIKIMIAMAAVTCLSSCLAVFVSLVEHVTFRSYQITKTTDGILLDVGLDLRNSLFFLEGPPMHSHEQVKIELLGSGKRIGQDYFYIYPTDIKMFPQQGSTGYARVTADRKKIMLRMYWLFRGSALVETMVNGNYLVDGHDELPPDALVVEPESLRWGQAEAGIEKTVTIRTGRPSEVQVIKFATLLSVLTVETRLEPSENKQVWKLVVIPQVVAHDAHASLVVRADVDGKERRAMVSISVSGIEEMIKGDNQMTADGIVVAPTQLTWEVGETRAAKRVTIRTDSPAEVKIAEVRDSHGNFEARIEPTRDRNVWRLVVSPKDTSRLGRGYATFRLEVTVAGQTRSGVVTVDVRPKFPSQKTISAGKEPAK